jgi:spore coat polysaccharide biosynthesis protein SpsF
LHALVEESLDPDEREHVTLGIYRRPQQFRLGHLRGNEDNSNLRWTVDNLEDFEFVESVYAALYDKDPHFEYESILHIIRNGFLESRTSGDAKRNAALDGKDTGAMRHA